MKLIKDEAHVYDLSENNNIYSSNNDRFKKETHKHNTIWLSHTINCTSCIILSMDNIVYLRKITY